MQKDQPVLVGKLLAPHGVRGLLRLRVYLDDAKQIFKMPLLLAGGTPLKLHHRGQQQENFLVALDNVASRDAADAWRGKEIFAQRIHLPPTAEAEFYVTDLQGMGAFDASGQALGTVTAVYDFGAGASLEITGLDRKTHIVPFNNRCVPQVDMAAQKIVVEMPHEIVVLPEGQHHD